MRWLIHHIILILAVVLAAAPSFAQQLFSKDIWLDETNVQVKVNCLAMDGDNYLWMGTDEGLFHYNGRRFGHVPTGIDAPVTAVEVYGTMVLAGFGNGSLGVWDGAVFRPGKLYGDVPQEAISSIRVIADNFFVVATVGDGIFLVHNGFCTSFNMSDGLSDDYIYSIVSPASGLLLAATDQGINEIRFAGGKISVQHYTTADGLPDNIVRVIKPMRVKKWSWLGTHQGGLALYCSETRQTWTPPTKEPWRWGAVNDILPVGDDRAWVCTQGGYLLDARLDDSGGINFREHHYPGQRLYRLLMDSTGNIWCGTATGLKLFAADYVSAIKLPPPFALSELTAMTCDNGTELWLAQKEKLYSLSLAGQDAKPVLRYTSSSPVTNLYYDRNGVLWVGTFGEGLWYSEDRRVFKKIKGILPLEKESILDISGSGNKMWISGLNGVEELEVRNKHELVLVKLHNKGTGIGSDYVYEIFPDYNGNTWMATDGAGVSMYSNGTYRLWDSASGMVSNVAYSIAGDRYGRIWASTFNSGLLVYNGKTWQSLDAGNGLQSLRISAITPTVNGTMLVVHAKGIDEWHHGYRMFRHFERRLGIGIDSVSATLNLAATDSAGNVYIPYQDGLIRFGKSDYHVNILPRVKITSLSTFFRETGVERKQFNYSENHITFRYDGVSFSNPDQLFYRYKLEGFNDGWISTSDQSVTFPQLPSGDYNFVVQVSMNSLFTGYSEARHAFTIARPFWAQWWFIFLAAALIWFVSLMYIRIRERNLRKLSMLQRERMMFEYEHLKSQVNPHFLFNSLNTLTGLIEEDSAAAMNYTSRLSDLYRNMLSHKDKDLISLAEEWEIVEHYIYVQKTRFGDALQVAIDIPEKLKRTKKVVPMALQLLLENAIKHNIVSRTQPLAVKFLAGDDELVISNTYQPKISKEKGAGLGLANIRKRYGLHTRREVKVAVTGNEFIVTIPLI